MTRVASLKVQRLIWLEPAGTTAESNTAGDAFSLDQESPTSVYEPLQQSLATNLSELSSQ